MNNPMYDNGENADFSQGNNYDLPLDLISATEDPSVLSYISNFLADPDPAISASAINALIRSKSQSAALAASAHLHSSAQKTRDHALRALVGIGLPSLPIFDTLLAWPDPAVRKSACDALTKIGQQAISAALAKALCDEDNSVVISAVRGLASIGSLETIPTLIALLQNPSRDIRIAVIAAMGELGGERALQALCALPTDSSLAEIEAIIDAVGWAGNANPRVAFDFLFEKLSSPMTGVPEVAFIAFNVLISKEGFLPSDVQENLMATISERIHLDVDGQQHDSLPPTGALDNHHIHFLLTNIARSNNPEIRANAIEGLIKMNHYSTEQLIAMVFQSSHSAAVRVQSLHRLARIIDSLHPDTYGLSDLLTRLISEGCEPQVLSAALRFLCEKNPQAGIPLAVNALRKTEADVSTQDTLLSELFCCPTSILLSLIVALFSITSLKLKLLTLLTSPNRIAEVLELGDGKALLISCIGDDDWQIRLQTVNILGLLHTPWSTRLILQACMDYNVDVRATAFQLMHADSTQPN
jgi:HEAT repeat protein